MIFKFVVLACYSNDVSATKKTLRVGVKWWGLLSWNITTGCGQLKLSSRVTVQQLMKFTQYRYRTLSSQCFGRRSTMTFTFTFQLSWTKTTQRQVCVHYQLRTLSMTDRLHVITWHAPPRVTGQRSSVVQCCPLYVCLSVCLSVAHGTSTDKAASHVTADSWSRVVFGRLWAAIDNEVFSNKHF